MQEAQVWSLVRELGGERICLPMQESQAPFLGQDDPLQKEMATHSSILAWEIPWAKERGGLQSVGSQKSRAWLSTHTHETRAPTPQLRVHTRQGEDHQCWDDDQRARTLRPRPGPARHTQKYFFKKGGGGRGSPEVMWGGKVWKMVWPGVQRREDQLGLIREAWKLPWLRSTGVKRFGAGRPISWNLPFYALCL